MDIKNIKLSKPLILVETDSTITRGTYANFSAKIIKTAEESGYKEGDRVYTEANYFIPYIVDGFNFENIYQINETIIKGQIDA
jgi:hypothetical protein